MLTQRQIYQLIKDARFIVSETMIRIYIQQKRGIHKKCSIRQEYRYGYRFEYYFGEVKLIIDAKQAKSFLAILTASASSFRWAYLYHDSKMEFFLDSQVLFFEMLSGFLEESIYDNMCNVVNKFIGKSEENLNEQLIRVAIYYGFSINVTNCFLGNEKGNVEEVVKFIHSEAYVIKYEFSSFEKSCDYLQKELIIMNKNSSIEEEKKHLSFYRPRYETARVLSLIGNEYTLFSNNDIRFYIIKLRLIRR